MIEHNEVLRGKVTVVSTKKISSDFKQINDTCYGFGKQEQTELHNSRWEEIIKMSGQKLLKQK